MSDQKTAPAPAVDVVALIILVEAGGFRIVAPDWVPRSGYAKPTPDLLRAVEAGLKGAAE